MANQNQIRVAFQGFLQKGESRFVRDAVVEAFLRAHVKENRQVQFFRRGEHRLDERGSNPFVDGKFSDADSSRLLIIAQPLLHGVDVPLVQIAHPGEHTGDGFGGLAGGIILIEGGIRLPHG